MPLDDHLPVARDVVRHCLATLAYRAAKVLRDVSLTVAPGEVVTLVGRNGAGKTTLLR